MFDYFWWHASVLWIGSFAIYWIATQKSRLFSTAVFVLILSLFLGVFGYTRFGQMHSGRTYHYSEVWHYYLGSKYYNELSQKYLYVSVIGAFEELKAKREVPHPTVIRNLEQPFQTYSYDEADRIFKEQARSHFTDARWAQFKADIEGFLNCPWNEWDWKPVEDVGYNPPPTYSAVAGSIASLIPITPGTISFIPFIDWSLMALAAGIIFRTFGFLGAAVFLLIFSTNDLASLYWIGGSFCRNFWVFALTVAICALEKRRYLLAGAAYGFAIAMRVFPFVFLFGACLAFLPGLCKDWRKNYQPIAQLLLGAVLVLATLILISLIKYPFSNWIDFFSKILLHNKTFFVMHLSYDKLAANTLNLGPQFFNEGISSFENWNVLLNDRFNEHWIFHRSMAMLFTAGAIFVGLRVDSKMASLLVGETILFFFALPANYYYIYLATFGVVTVAALKETPLNGNSLRFWCLMSFLIICNMVGAISGDWIVLNWWINLALLCLLFIYIVSQVVQKPFNWNTDKHQLFITGIFIVLLVIVSFKPRELPSTNTNGLKTQVLMFTPKDIESGTGWIQDLHNNYPHWPTKDHLLANNPNGVVSVVKYFVIPQRGKYLVTIFHDSAVDFVNAQVKISSIILLQVPMQTWSPYPVYGQDSYVCEFQAGKNSIHIFGIGNPVRRYLGINSIILKPL
jgi:hypothetical protein